MIPATGENINAARTAGTSLKSIFRNGGSIGNGKFKKNKSKDIVPSNARIISFNSFDLDCVVFTINPSFIYISITSVMKEITACFMKKPLKSKRISGAGLSIGNKGA